MIYADNASTTIISDSALKEMLPYLQEQYGNASNKYSFGMKSRKAIEKSRLQIANLINANAKEILFTSGGSESNSWVLNSIHKSSHIITSAIEHHSVLNACQALEKQGVEVTYLPCANQGVVNIEDLINSIKPNTQLVSIMLANNEIGTIQHIAKIGEYLHNKKILFHTDAVQAIGHISVDVNELNVDFLSASAHKFNGSKGIGFLYKRNGVNVSPLIFGGNQEFCIRGGTENTAAIVGMSYALNECVNEMQETTKRLMDMVHITENIIKNNIPDILINGNGVQRLQRLQRLPGIINIIFNNISGEALMNVLDLKGICVSTGSACTSGIDQPSHVLLSLGYTPKQANSAIRISYGKYNTEAEAVIVANTICECYNKLSNAI